MEAQASPEGTRPPSSYDIENTKRQSSLTMTTESAYNDANQPRSSLAHDTHLFLDDVQAVNVDIRDLGVTVDTPPSWLEKLRKTGPKESRKTLLHSISASLEAGTLTAIIGGSGSGKTTLLNTLAERMISPRLAESGSTTFNGVAGVQSTRHAYVMQQDVLLPSLTVRETLQYAAALRLPPSTTAAQSARVVEEVILELGLKECADTRVGSTQHKGCSGGEKRRTSIGVQLLANPSVLFLDEPTTGLDATSAFQLVKTLKGLAAKGRTIIMTIHQPRSEIWDRFDSLVVLARGGPVYSGPAKGCIPWFDGQGFKIPPFVNPAEFVIDIAAVDNRTPELEAETTSRVEGLKRAWNTESQLRYPSPSAEAAARPRIRKPSDNSKHASFLRQLVVLTNRTFKVTYRDPMGMMASIFEGIMMAIITGYIFYNLARDDSGIRSREGALYTAAGLQGYLLLIFEVYRLTIDIPTFDREHSEGCSDVLPFMLSRRFARFFTEDIPVPFLYSVIFYFMAGFDRDAEKFFIFFAITLLNHYVAMSCAMTCVATVRHFPGASMMANLIYTLQSMACGIFVQANSLPVYVRWMKWITYTFYAFGAYSGNEFEGGFYDCPFPGGRDNPDCASYTGEYIMDSLGFPNNWVMRPIIILLGFASGLLLLSGVLLYFLKVEMTIARARTSDTDLSAGKEKMKPASITEVRAIDVGLDNFALGLDKRAPWGKKLPRKTILNPVSATFQSGVLNVIMGPSGSGKTSLLNSMALRLHSTLGTKYLPSGRLTFNSAVPSPSVVRSVCSYVCQDDDALLPSLTVRETLRFAAGLRLPSWMSKEEKAKRAEDVLLKMGLKDCADNLVGSELIKGISGGEKRRVSIAVQVLTDPRILLLDEPTSGLDAFTANSIMEVLQGLAAEGRTVILTIHQARSDLFKHFGNVLLLARGGHCVYTGKAAEMLGYFRGHGYECPRHANPADFVMDLISVDLREEGRERESREKVTKLIAAWKEAEGNVPEAGGLFGIEEAEEVTQEKPARSYVEESGVSTTEAAASRTEKDAVASPQEEEDDLTPVRPTVSSVSRRSVGRATLATPAELGALVRKRTSLAAALPLLLHRAIINFRRQPPLIIARIMQVVSLGLIFSLFFAPMDDDFFSVQNRMGFVQQVGAFYFVGMLQNVAVYPAERDVFYREYDDGVYGAEAFLAGYTILEVPCEIVSCLIFGVLAVFAVGLPRTVELYFASAFCCFGIVSCGESIGIMFNTVFSHTGFAVNLTSVVLSVATCMGGILSTDMPPFLEGVNYLSPVRYATRALGPFSLRGVRFRCDEEHMLGGSCILGTGEDALDLYKLNVDPVVNIAALAGCVVVYRVLAWGVLRVVRTRWREG
ncbi:related to A.gambiae ATP-binding-cassette protein [Cephalotrichum gorgonifer]|uniref:Related to A.gambiae ATP-binding-cassette protein n=1 Tax=Cephalotrichum gorgonifer TaxID=2041049 RepID=A0AAE8N7D0_9PEZI|nr:related to A.gambiae ATP-binding-cassette protein [Cephalotrichum gorgonifer]